MIRTGPDSNAVELLDLHEVEAAEPVMMLDLAPLYLNPLWSAWTVWPTLCLAWQREFNDIWIAHWAGGVPLDG